MESKSGSSRRHPLRWVLPFTVINGTLLLLGLLVHVGLRTSLRVVHSVPLWGVAEVVLVVKNALMMVGVDVMTGHRPRLHQGNNGNDEDSPRWGAVAVSVVKFSVQEAMVYRLALYWGLVDHAATLVPTTTTLWGLMANAVAFVAVSFMYEVVFDFGHYWTHRWLHLSPPLYRAFHAAHHRHSNPTVYDTFDDTIGGNFLTNCLPQLVALVAVVALLGWVPLPHSCYALLLVYKAVVEVSGHLGKDIGNASSFPQCKVLPGRLGIALSTQDHHRHHRNGKTNFAKRFSLWDKCFGTYHNAKELSHGDAAPVSEGGYARYSTHTKGPDTPAVGLRQTLVRQRLDNGEFRTRSGRFINH
jgi:hypothetical protein